MKRTLISAALLSGMAGPAFSGTMGEMPKMPWFVMLSGGPVWSASGEKQTISLQPGVVNTYQPDRNVSTFGTGSVFLGVDRDFWHGSRLEAGVAFTGSGPDVVRGGVWQDANPNFDNFAMAVGYQITSWGNSNLGPANLQTTSTRLGLSSIYANEMQFSLIYTA